MRMNPSVVDRQQGSCSPTRSVVEPIVGHFCVLKERLSGLCRRLKANSIHTFSFERSKEGLAHGMVITIPTARHAHTDPELSEDLLVLLASTALEAGRYF